MIDQVKLIPRPTHGKTGGEIEYYQDNGQEMRKYIESGVIQVWRPDIGKSGRWVFAKGTAKAAMITSTEQAQALVNTRWDMVREAAVLGIMDATGKTTEPDALRELQRVYASHSIAGGRGGAAYADKVLELADLRKPREQQPGNQPPGTFQLTVTGSIQQLRDAMRRKYHRVIDVEPSEPDSD